MRRLEEVLHDLAEQDERLPTSELITRIERRLSGESDVPVVVIDGRSEMGTHKNTRQTQRRRWTPTLVAAGAALLVLLVVGLPILFFNGGESIVADQPATTAPPSATTVSPTTAAPTTSPTTTVPSAAVDPFPPSNLAVLEVPLSEAVPGFTDTIVMLATPVNGFGVVRWRPSEPMTELALSLDRGVSWREVLDASGTWLAHVEQDGGALIVSRIPVAGGGSLERETVGLLVEEVAWHDSEPGQLAWLASPEGPTGAATLFTLDVTDQTAEPVPVRSFEHGFARNPFYDEWDGPGVTLERWGNVGVVVRSYEESSEGFGPGSLESVELVLVNVDGSETSMGSGIWWIADGPDGTSIWRDNFDDPPYLLSPDGRHRSAVLTLADDEFLFDAWWSPDGTRLALGLDKHGGLSPGKEVLRVVDVVSGEIIAELEEPEMSGWGNAVAWSTDNRFFLYAPDDGSNVGPATLVFYDTATNAATMVPTTADVWDIRVR